MSSYTTSQNLICHEILRTKFGLFIYIQYFFFFSNVFLCARIVRALNKHRVFWTDLCRRCPTACHKWDTNL